MHFSDVEVGKQLIVGNGTYYDTLGLGENVIRGSAYIEGPLLAGDAKSFGKVVATTMIARDKNEESNNPNRSLHVKGNTRLQGDGATTSSLYVTGGSTHAAKFSGGAPDAVYIEGDLYVSGSTDTGNKGRLASRFATADAKPKPFDLVHPTKEGYRLRYACIEGPEVGVYCRGRVKNDTEIVLPEYWRNLVHVDSISVQLQPIGAHQDIIVKRWDEEKIYLQAKAGFPINCFYHVYGERNDVNPVLVEYQGNSRYDYPDPNWNEESGIPVEERNYTDPNYLYPRNTITT